MAQLDVRRLYASGTTPTQEQLDAFVDDIETLVNLTKLNDDNVQDAGITASDKIIDGTITTAKFQNGAVTAAKILDDAVTTAKIADGAVTAAKITDANVTNAKMGTGVVTTAKIDAAAVTTAKISTNLVFSSAIGQAFSANSDTLLSGSSTAITTVGNPVLLGFIPGTTGGEVQVLPATSVAFPGATISFFRDGTKVGSCTAASYKNSSGTSSGYVYYPVGQFMFIDEPSAGAHTYTAKVWSFSSPGSVICQMFALEIH